MKNILGNYKIFNEEQEQEIIQHLQEKILKNKSKIMNTII